MSLLGKQLTTQFSVGLLWREACHLDMDPVYMCPVFWGKAGGEEGISLTASGAFLERPVCEGLAAIALN